MTLTHSSKLWLLAMLTIILAAAVFLLKPIPQDLAYHSFADHRTFFGIPNFLNVVSNLPFVLIGLYGLGRLAKTAVPASIGAIYAVIFLGITLTGIGSAYYHLSPDNNTLLFDRLPLTLVFMGLLSAIVSQFISDRLAIRILIPLLLVGIGSVLWWHYTESKGAGDLRLYGFVQFYPMVFIPLVIFLFPSSAAVRCLHLLKWIVIWYVIAKLFEYFDKQIFSMGHIISGHSLKHLAAAITTWLIVKMFQETHLHHSTPLHPSTP